MSADATDVTVGADRRGVLARLARRAGWNIADQGLVSLNNLALSLLVARSVDSEAFGAFTVAFTVYSIAVLASRALVSQPMMIRFSGADPARFRVEAGRSTGAAVVLGMGLGVVALVVGLVLDGGIGTALLAMALVLPGLLLQDSWRMVFFAQRRPERATLVDAAWMVLQLTAVGVFMLVGLESVVPYVLAWGLTALVAGILGAWRGGTAPHLAATVPFLRTHWGLTGYLLFEALLLQGAYQGALLLAGTIGSLSDIGSLRGAQVVLGPVTLLATSAVAFGVPEISRRTSMRARHRNLFAVGLGGILALGAVAWGAIMLLLPDSAGTALLGDSWDGVRMVLLATVVGQVGNCISVGPSCVVHAMGKSVSTFRIHVAVSVMLLVFGVGGLWLGGAEGAAWGFALAYWTAVPFWFLTLHRLGRAADHAQRPAASA